MSEINKRIKHQWRGAMKKRRSAERDLIIATARRLLGDPNPLIYSFEGKTYKHYKGKDSHYGGR